MEDPAEMVKNFLFLIEKRPHVYVINSQGLKARWKGPEKVNRGKLKIANSWNEAEKSAANQVLWHSIVDATYSTGSLKELYIRQYIFYYLKRVCIFSLEQVVHFPAIFPPGTDPAITYWLLGQLADLPSWDTPSLINKSRI